MSQPRLLHLLLPVILAMVAWAQSPAAAPLVQSFTHLGLSTDFEPDTFPLSPRPAGQDEPATVGLTRVREEGRGFFARLTNLVSGGFVGLDLLPHRQPLALPTRLAFDYRADPALKVNLFLRVQSVDYEIGLWGPRSDLGQAVWLGRVEGAVADGQWHRMELPLLGLLRQRLPELDTPRLTDLYLANQCQADYLLAGFGGNPAGVRLDLDNLELWRPGGANGVVSWQAAAGQAVETWGVVVDDQAGTEPVTGNVPADQASRDLNGLAAGEQWLHVRGFQGGQGGVTAHYRLPVSLAPPTAQLASPAAGAASAPDAVRVTFQSAVGIAPRSLTVSHGDQTWRVGDPGLRFDAASGELAIDLAQLETVVGEGTKAPLTWTDGQPVALTVNAADENGVALAQPLPVAFTLRLAEDRTPPTQEQLALAWPGDAAPQPLPGEGTFEYGLDEWMAHGAEPVVVERTDTTAAAGRYSLHLVCGQNGSNFTTYVRRSPYDLSRFRVISFDYKADPRLRLDFLFLVSTPLETRYLRVIFSDRDRDGAVIGRVPEVVLDGQWRHAEFNLYDMVRQALPDQDSYTIQGVLLNGGRWSDSPQRFAGNYAGTDVYFDNFFFVPTLSAEAQLHWSGRDLSGLSGARLAAAPTMDGLPGAQAAPDAGRRVEGASTSLEGLGSGLTYLWVRPVDGQGNLGAPLVTRVVLASGRPEIERVWPGPDGARVAPQPIGLSLRYDREVGLDLSSVELEVAGLKYTGQSATLALDRERGELTWDGRRSEPQVQLPDGQPVTVRLLNLRDQAGNSPTELPTWTFTVDYALDKTGPTVDVLSRTHTSVWADDLSDNPPRWAAAADEPVTTAREALPGEDGWAIAVTPSQNGSPYTLWRQIAQPYSLLRFGYLYLEYQVPVGASLDLFVRLGPPPTGTDPATTQARVRLVPADQVGAPVAGVPSLAIVADGNWHPLVVPLADLLRGGQVPTNPYVRAVGLGSSDGTGVTAGATWRLAAPRAMRAGTSAVARLSWTARDETGVTGYVAQVDQDLRSQPPLENSTTDTELRLDDVPGPLSWLHVRARDGAGNWGPTAHFPLYAPPPGG